MGEVAEVRGWATPPQGGGVVRGRAWVWSDSSNITELWRAWRVGVGGWGRGGKGPGFASLVSQIEIHRQVVCGAHTSKVM